MNSFPFSIKSVVLSILFLASAGLFQGCKSTDVCVGETTPALTTGPKGPRKIYVPEYYVYRNGRYEFVKGHYRWVLSRKTYYKRSMRGYTNRGDEAASFR